MKRLQGCGDTVTTHGWKGQKTVCGQLHQRSFGHTFLVARMSIGDLQLRVIERGAFKFDPWIRQRLHEGHQIGLFLSGQTKRLDIWIQFGVSKVPLRL